MSGCALLEQCLTGGVLVYAHLITRSRLAMTTRPRPTIFLSHRRADDGKRFLTDLVGARDVVRGIQIPLVDLVARHERVDHRLTVILSLLVSSRSP